ncbi:MAG: hypothetical protein AAGD28_10895 [Bacteroidota bacterium]
MKILILKTDLQDDEAVDQVQDLLNGHPDIEKWTVDTEDIDKVLRIEAKDELSYDEVIAMVNYQNFNCEELED